MLPHDHNIWALIFEQTPTALRWILGILTCGVFWLIQRLYINHKERINRLEILIIKTSDTSDAKVTALHEKVDKLTLTILDK